MVMKMYNYELILIGGNYVRDKSGNYVFQETNKTSVLCDLKSVTRSEYYSAAQAGLNPEEVFEINGFEYAKEPEVEFMGERYSVIRTFRTSYETIELTCGRKSKHGSFIKTVE